MKNHLICLQSLFLFAMGCSDNPTDQPTIVQAVLPAHILSNEKWDPAISVQKAREIITTGKTLTVEGFIGGRKKPFTQSKAMFILGDDSLKTCDEIPGDSCPTPWDVCCEDPRKISSSTLSVQILDENGSLLSGTLEGVAGIEAGKRIKVQGTVSANSSTQAMVLEATALQLLEK